MESDRKNALSQLTSCLLRLHQKKELEQGNSSIFKERRSWIRKSNKRKRVREKRYETQKLIYELIEHEKSKPCTDCGRNLSGHMTFDHLPEFSKRISPCEAKTFITFFNELKKCQVVCCICHHIRERTRNRSGHHCPKKDCQFDKIKKFLHTCYQSFLSTQIYHKSLFPTRKILKMHEEAWSYLERYFTKLEDIRGDICDIYEENPPPVPILIWPFYQAPEVLRKLSQSGGDEDWLVVFNAENKRALEKYPLWLEVLDSGRKPEEHKVGPFTILIGAHA